MKVTNRLSQISCHSLIYQTKSNFESIAQENVFFSLFWLMKKTMDIATSSIVYMYTVLIISYIYICIYTLCERSIIKWKATQLSFCRKRRKHTSRDKRMKCQVPEVNSEPWKNVSERTCNARPHLIKDYNCVSHGCLSIQFTMFLRPQQTR